MATDLSTYAKLTAQAILGRFNIRLSPEGAKSVFENPACGEVMKPLVDLLLSKMLLEKVITRERNCQDMLLEFIRRDTEVEDTMGEGIRQQLSSDKDTLVNFSANLSALEAQLDGYIVGCVTNAEIADQISPIRRDLAAANSMVADIRTEVKASSGGTIELMGESLAAKDVGALHNPNSNEVFQQLATKLALNPRELSPVKRALVVALLGEHLEQADDQQMRNIIKEILNSKAVRTYETAFTQDPQVYRNSAEFGRELTIASGPDRKDMRDQLIQHYQKFAKLEADIESHRDQWAATVQFREAKKPVPETGLENVTQVSVKSASS